MKKILLTVLALGLFCLGANASVLVSESFDYPDGSISTQSGGTGFSGSWAYGTKNDWYVSSGVLTNNLAESSSARRSLATTLTSDFYFSLSVSYSGSLGTTVNDVLYLSNKNGTTVTNIAGVGFYRSSPTATSTTYNVNLLGQPSLATNHYMPETYSYSDTEFHQIVGKISYNGDGTLTLSVWVDPTDVETSTAYSTLTITSAIIDINQIGLVRNSSGTGAATETLNVDNLLIGTTWFDVVPEPNSLSLLLGATGMGMVYSVMRRRR